MIDRFDEIISEIEENNISNFSFREKYICLKWVLERCCKEITSGESLQFPSLFSRLVFISQKFDLPRSVEWNLQNIRVKSSFLQKSENNIVSSLQYDEALATIRAFLSTVYNKSKSVNSTETIKHDSAKPQSKDNYIRIQVIDIQFENYIIVGKSNRLEESEIYVRYNVSGVNDMFTPSMHRLWIGAQLNIVDYKIDEQGWYIPKFLVLEPDYLVDTSAMAECFQNYGESYLHYFRRKFEPTANSKHILLGNLANFFLDELVFSDHPESEDFNKAFLESFRQKPFEYTSCNEIKRVDDFRTFMSKARTQFENIKRVVKHDFPVNQIDVNKCTLEPSFFCEKFGFQGRLDLLQSPDDKVQKHNIVELKSGGLPFPKDDPTKITINHEVQTTIYRLIIQSAFKIDSRQVSASILYSAAENLGENLRLAATYRKLEKEIIEVRNQIVATEHDLYMGDNDTVKNLFSEICDLDNYGRVPDFFRIRINDFEKVIRTTTELERSYFFRYIRFIARELYIQKVGDDHYESNTSTASLWNSEFSDRQETFDLIANLEIISINESGRDMKILFKRNDTTDFINFREGEICILYPRQSSTDTVLSNQILKGTIAKITKQNILLRFRYKQKNKSFFKKYASWVIEHDKLDHTYNSMYKSLFSFLMAPIEKRSLLLGKVEPKSVYLDDKSIDNTNTEMERIQNRILQKAITAKDYFLIVGPPGTGKTSIFARRLIEHYYNNTQDNILIIAYTNRAVDELCEAINQAFDCQSSECDRYIRIGAELSCGENYRHRLLQNISEQAKSREDLRVTIGKQRIFIGTLASIVGKPEIFDIKHFNISIIDEASQILEPQIVGILPKVDKFIMIGDHKQLSTITLQSKEKSRVNEPQLNIIELYNCSESLFERLFRICKKNNWMQAYDTLIYQGRMHEKLSAFPNKYFYDNQLKSVSEWQTEISPKLKYNKSDVYESIVSENRQVFLHANSTNNSLSDKINYDEAEIVVSLCRAIVNVYRKNNLDFDPQKSLGIITPYRNQIALIKHKLQESEIGELQNTMIDTVERFQGSQRDIIILSFCMNKPYQLDFFCNLNIEKTVDRKLNVALTRARKQIFLVGNKYILRKNPIYSLFLDSLS